VDTNLDHDHLHDVLPPSKPPSAAPSEVNHDPEEGEEEDPDGATKPNGPAPFPGGISPHTLWGLKRVLIVKSSHVGQHKFAGNVIVSDHTTSLDQFRLGAFSPSFTANSCRTPLGVYERFIPPNRRGFPNLIPMHSTLHSAFRYSVLSVYSPFRLLRTFVISHPFRNPVQSNRRLTLLLYHYLSLDLHSWGAVDLVQPRHSARSRRHRRTDHRSGKDHTLTL